MQIFYTVHTGDTLNNIALRWNIPLRSLIEANNLSLPYIIYPGQPLSMPPGVNTYPVRTGDTLYTISQRFRIPADIIATANGIGPPYTIIPGMVINIPSGVPYYSVRQGDTLYKIAARYNVTIGGQPRPDLIIDANEGLTPDIIPGMFISVPYTIPESRGLIATILSDGFGYYIGIYNSYTGDITTIRVSDEADRNSSLFWSPDQSRLAYISKTGIISIIDVKTGYIVKIDQIDYPYFIDWSHDGTRVSYSTGSHVRIYNVLNHGFYSINSSGISYVQWFPGDMKFLYEREDNSGNSQLYTSNTDGTDIRKITNNQNGLLNHVRLSPDGNYVLYTSPGASISMIYTMDLAAGSVYQIPGGPEAKNYNPVWSPDSTRIAYSSTQYVHGKYYSQIRVSGIKGQNDTTIAIAGCYSTPLAWAEDSSSLVYLSGCREDVPPVEVWSISLKKPVPENIMSGYLFFNVDW